MGVTKKMHRKRLLRMIDETKCAPIASAPAAEATGGGCAISPATDVTDAAVATGAISAASRRFSEPSAATKLFMSYPRGDETTPFARKLKAALEANGFVVWMDEEGIAGGADFMNAIGDAIKASQAVIAVIDQKFCGSQGLAFPTTWY